jgi:hypothetical protein
MSETYRIDVATRTVHVTFRGEFAEGYFMDFDALANTPVGTILSPSGWGCLSRSRSECYAIARDELIERGLIEVDDDRR